MTTWAVLYIFFFFLPSHHNQILPLALVHIVALIDSPLQPFYVEELFRTIKHAETEICNRFKIDWSHTQKGDFHRKVSNSRLLLLWQECNARKGLNNVPDHREENGSQFECAWQCWTCRHFSCYLVSGTSIAVLVLTWGRLYPNPSQMGGRAMKSSRICIHVACTETPI